jgi:hypothetical protein
MWKPITIQISLPAGIAPSSDLLHYLLNANSVFLKESTPQKGSRENRPGLCFYCLVVCLWRVLVVFFIRRHGFR